MKKDIQNQTGEHQRIEMLLKCFKGNQLNMHSNCIIGLGSPDDAAVIQSNNKMVIATDFIRGTQFDLFKSDHMNYFDIGYYLVIANISDIAAMGAEPKFLLTVIRYTKSVTDTQFNQLCKGISEACQAYNIDVIGGDTGSYTETVLTATAVGESPTGNNIIRGGAKPGDLVCLTGATGLALSCWLYYSKFTIEGSEWFNQEELDELLLSWQRPKARVKQGLCLNKLNLATACQDTSDGLYTTLIQMSEASKVGIKIYESKLPMHPLVLKLSRRSGIPCNELVFGTSVDFQLAFTIPEEKLQECEEAFKQLKESFSVIGEVTSNQQQLFITSENTQQKLPGSDWDQKENYLETLVKLRQQYL